MTSQFSEHYANLSSEELAELALRNELVPDAQQCLNTEFARRGITDLEPYRRLFEQERAQIVARSNDRIDKQKNWTIVLLRIHWAVCIFLALAVIWLWFIGDQPNAIGVSITLAIFLPSYWAYIKLRFLFVKWFLRP